MQFVSFLVKKGSSASVAFYFASRGCIFTFTTMFVSAWCRLASAEVFSPVNLHCMKEQLDLWPSLWGWPADPRPSRFTAGKRKAGLCHLEDLLEASFNKETYQHCTHPEGFCAWELQILLITGGSAQSMASIYGVTCHQLMTALHFWSFNNKSLKSQHIQNCQ